MSEGILAQFTWSLTRTSRAKHTSETSSKESNEMKKERSVSTKFEGFTLVNSFWQQDESISFLRPNVGADEINFPPGTNLEMVEVSFSQSTLRENFKATKLGNANIVKTLDFQAEAAYCLHVDENNREIVTRLFTDNTRIQIATDLTNPAAELVLCGKNISVIEKLLQSGVSINYRNKEGGSLARYAAARSSISLIPILKRYGVDLNGKGSDGFTPLHIAIQNKNLEVLRVLLDNGANPNILTVDGHSPLYLAVKAGFSEAVVVLMESGADVSAVDEEKHVLLSHFSSLASEVDDSRIIDILLMIGFDYDSIASSPAVLISAVERKDFGLAKTLLEHGACPHQKHDRKKPYEYRLRSFNRQTSNETTAIHLACASGDEKMVELLLDHGADLNVVCGPEIVDSPIKIAIVKLDSKIVSLLISNGANVYERADLLKLPLLCEDRHPYDVTKSLLENGCCDVNVDHDRVKPILFIVKCAISHTNGSEKEKLKMMMKYGVSVDFHDLVLAIHISMDADRIRHEVIEFFDVFFAWCFTDLKDSDESNIHNLFRSVDLFYSDDDDGINDYPPLKVHAGMLAKHLVKLSVAGKHINEKVIPPDFVDHFDLEVLRDQCEDEIYFMKRKIVHDPHISLYDVLTKDTEILSRYLKNENIRLMLSNYNFKEEFPNYGLIIKYRVRQAKWRREFFIGGMKAFNWLVVRLPRLPFEVKENILDLLRTQDLIKLKLCVPSK